MPAIAIFAILAIAVPWLGAVLVWLVQDSRPRLQHTLAVLFAIGGGVAACGMIPRTTAGNARGCGQAPGLLPLAAGRSRRLPTECNYSP